MKNIIFGEKPRFDLKKGRLNQFSVVNMCYLPLKMQTFLLPGFSDASQSIRGVDK